MRRGDRAVGAVIACAPSLAGFAASRRTIRRVDTIVVRVAQVTFRTVLALIGRSAELAGVGVTVGVAPAGVAFCASLAFGHVGAEGYRDRAVAWTIARTAGRTGLAELKGAVGCRITVCIDGTCIALCPSLTDTRGGADFSNDRAVVGVITGATSGPELAGVEGTVGSRITVRVSVAIASNIACLARVVTAEWCLETTLVVYYTVVADRSLLAGLDSTQ